MALEEDLVGSPVLRASKISSGKEVVRDRIPLVTYSRNLKSSSEEPKAVGKEAALSRLVNAVATLSFQSK